MSTRLQIGLVAATLLAAPLAAQQHQHSDTLPAAGKQQMGMNDCAMMSSMMSMMGQGGGMSMMGQGSGMSKMGQSGGISMMGQGSGMSKMGQSGGMSMMGQPGGMEMMTTMRYAPSHVLKNKGLLKLSPDQLSRIEAMTAGGMGMHGMGMAGNSMMEQMQTQLKTAFDSSPADSAAIAAAVMPMVATHGSMMVQQLVMATRARDVLTAAQREQLSKLPSPCMNGDSGMTMKRKMPASRR